MGLSINTNMSAMNTARQMSKAGVELGKTFEKLSTGLKINRAADDAGRFKIAEKFNSQIKGLGQAIRNANDGISVVQVAEGALNETTSLMQRMRELAVQSSNGAYSDTDRKSLQDEVNALRSEFDRIATDTTFNGRKLLDGSYTSQFQVGADAGQTIGITIENAETNNFGMIAQQNFAGPTAALAITADSVYINGVAVKASSDYAASNGRVDTSAYAKAKAINASNTGIRAEAQATGATSLAAAAMNGTETLDINGVTIINADATVTDFTKLASAINANSSATGVTAALNTDGTIALTAADGRNIAITNSTVGTGGYLAFTNNATTYGEVELTSNEAVTVIDASQQLSDAQSTVIALDQKTIRDIDLTSIEGASDAIDRLDSALGTVGTRRGAIGAIQNRLESTISNLSNVNENVTAARSRLLDVDFSTETLNMSKGMMLQQAGSAVLAQAKQASQIVLNMLQ